MIRAKTKALKGFIVAISGRGRKYGDRNAVARAIFRRWSDAHQDSHTNWTHGRGAKANAKPPDPDREQPYSRLSRYLDNRTAQNRRGWEMVAEILGVELSAIVDIVETDAGIAPLTPSMARASGDLPLATLANLDVARPQPLMGANTVDPDPDRKQAIGLIARTIFNTIHNEELLSEDGEFIANADIELTHAFVVVKLSDPNMMVLTGIGTDGTVRCGNVQVSYLGRQEDLVLFEVAAAEKATLAGIAQLLEKLVELEGRFNHDDFIGISFEKNGLRLVKPRFSDDEQPGSPKRPITEAIKTQVMRRGIVLDGPPDQRILAVRRYFMSPVINDPER